MNGRLHRSPLPAAALLDLWQSNADAWAQAVRTSGIESRRLATDRAVQDAVLRWAPRRVLDVGCGEGWLARALVGQGVAVRGLDAIPRLIELARQAGDGDYAVAAITDLQASPLAEGCDLWVCNFSLFHETDAPALIAAASQRLPAGGRLVIQTLHAQATAQGLNEGDGWQPGGWGNCGNGFADPIPWYFRRRQSWQDLLAASGFTEIEVQEPCHPVTGLPLSWIFTARRA